MERALLVYTTYPSIVEAERAGRSMVEQRLAACVNILPGMVSHYWWQGTIERGEEVVMIIKTRASLAERVRAFANSPLNWEVMQGSVLDADYMSRLPKADIVYSWGVLHHTGQMWQALDNVHRAVAPGGKLFIAIYNDMGSQSARWRTIKRTYNKLPKPLRLPFTVIVMMPSETKSLLRALATLRMREYIRSWTRPRPERGMSRWRDIVDWVGGYPYEVAKPEEIFDFYRARGFTLTRMQCGGVGLGCHQFVFTKEAPA